MKSLKKLRKLAEKAAKYAEGCQPHTKEDFMQITSKAEAKFYATFDPETALALVLTAITYTGSRE